METFSLITMICLALVSLLVEVSPTPIPTNNSIIFYTRLNQSTLNYAARMLIDRTHNKCVIFSAPEWHASELQLQEGVCVEMYDGANCQSSTKITSSSSKSFIEMDPEFIKPQASIKLCSDTTVINTTVIINTTATKHISTLSASCENLATDKLLSSIELPNGGCAEVFEGANCQGLYATIILIGLLLKLVLRTFLLPIM